MHALRAVCCLVLLSFPSLASAATAAVVLTEDGGFDPVSAQTVRRVAAEALSRHGLTVLEHPLFERSHPLDGVMGEAIASARPERLFVVRIGRLNSKVMLTVEERVPQSQDALHHATLAAEGLEEADLLVPRLIETVLQRTDPAKTARMRTVSLQEARPFLKKPGEHFFTVGLPIGLRTDVESAFGLSLAVTMEAEHFRVGPTLMGVLGRNVAAGVFALEVAWLPLTGEWSPYLGGGIGYMGTSVAGMNGGGAGLLAELGVELFRLNRARLMMGAQTMLPFYTATDGATVRRWSPFVILHTRLAMF
jgi:hypothetical protein